MNVSITSRIPMGMDLYDFIDELMQFSYSQSVDVKEIFLLTNEIEKQDTCTKENITIRIVNKMNINDINTDYLFIYKRDFKLQSKFIEILHEKMQSSKADFVFANNKKSSANHNQMSFEVLAGPKLIKKEYLTTIFFFNNDFLSSNQSEYMDFLLFDPQLKGQYGVVDKSIYKHDYNFDNKYVEQTIDNINEVVKKLIEKDFLLHSKNLMCSILKYQISIINSSVFLNNIEKEMRVSFLKSVNEITSKLSKEDLCSCDLDYLGSFFRLISIKCFDEAIEYLKLVKSKSYWYNQHEKFNQYFRKYPYDLRDSIMWKLVSRINKVSELFQKVKEHLYKYVVILLASFIKFFYFGKKVYLVGERADQAEDNGYFFFKYCREKKLKEKFYYVITKDSKDREKVERLGNVIYHSSFKHLLYMLVADVYISAWTFEECSYPLEKNKYKKYYGKLIENKKNVSLQHGVIIHNIAPYLSKERYKQDLIICSSKYEKEIIKETLGYSDNEVAVTGLSRFDNLHDIKVKKQILVMPTWRRSLFNKSFTEFLDSDYFKSYSNLLKNCSVQKLLDENDIELKFYIHSQMQNFMEYFNVNHPKIELLTKEKATVSELLKESALLITDYSSVTADFLYMNKPSILYQFDQYNNHHAVVNEIKYEDLGNVVHKEEELVKSIEEVISNKFILDKKHKRKSSKIFSQKDKSNTERIYNAISNL